MMRSHLLIEWHGIANGTLSHVGGVCVWILFVGRCLRGGAL